jgi:hypothetical protein
LLLKTVARVACEVSAGRFHRVCPQEQTAAANILMERAGSPCAPPPSADGGAVSTVIENLLARKQKLVELLEKAQAVEERDRIEHQLEQINTALDFLDRPGSKDGR